MCMIRSRPRTSDSKATTHRILMSITETIMIRSLHHVRDHGRKQLKSELVERVPSEMWATRTLPDFGSASESAMIPPQLMSGVDPELAPSAGIGHSIDSSRGGLQHGSANIGDDADVVVLAEVEGGAACPGKVSSIFLPERSIPRGPRPIDLPSSPSTQPCGIRPHHLPCRACR